jgi:hypothetical protein
MKESLMLVRLCGGLYRLTVRCKGSWNAEMCVPTLWLACYVCYARLPSDLESEADLHQGILVRWICENVGAVALQEPK